MLPPQQLSLSDLFISLKPQTVLFGYKQPFSLCHDNVLKVQVKVNRITSRHWVHLNHGINGVICDWVQVTHCSTFTPATANVMTAQQSPLCVCTGAPLFSLQTIYYRQGYQEKKQQILVMMRWVETVTFFTFYFESASFAEPSPQLFHLGSDKGDRELFRYWPVKCVTGFGDDWMEWIKVRLVIGTTTLSKASNSWL